MLRHESVNTRTRSAVMPVAPGRGSRLALLAHLALKDFRQRHLGSALGLCWAFVQPAVTVLVILLVFTAAFKSRPEDGHPYALWLLAGAAPWFFFAEGLSGSVQAVVERGFLVRHMVFDPVVLPLAKIASAALVHLAVTGIVGLVFAAFGRLPGAHALQLPYYFLASCALLAGLGLAGSALMVCLRDVGQAVAVFLQIWFWVTPVFWPVRLLDGPWGLLARLNPVAYLVEGYRDAFLGRAWFWEHGWWTASFWLVAGGLLWLGGRLFGRLKGGFADAL